MAKLDGTADVGVGVLFYLKPTGAWEWQKICLDAPYNERLEIGSVPHSHVSYHEIVYDYAEFGVERLSIRNVSHFHFPILSLFAQSNAHHSLTPILYSNLLLIMGPRLLSIISFNFVCLFVALLFSFTHATLSKLSRYRKECFEEISPCVMFMDDKQAYGCAQCGEDSRKALVHLLNQKADVDEISEEDEPRIFIMPENVFYIPEVQQKLRETYRAVAGVVVYEDEEKEETDNSVPLQGLSVSTDLTEPNERYNHYGDSTTANELMRNRVGLGTKFQIYPFNIFRINSAQGLRIVNNTKKYPAESSITFDSENTTELQFNRPGWTKPRYKLESKGQMYACPDIKTEEETFVDAIQNITSSDCLEDKTCLPIGGHSVWSSLGHLQDRPTGSNSPRKPVIAITAPMDSNAFFPGLAVGASAEISSTAVLLSIATSLRDYYLQQGKDREMKYDIIFLIWNAQSWGYAGSARFLKDVKEFECAEVVTDYNGLRNGCRDKYMDSLKFMELRNTHWTVININQITVPNVAGESRASFEFYAHSDGTGREPGDGNDNETTGIFDDLARYFGDDDGDNVLDLFANTQRNTPPIDASQSFRTYVNETNRKVLSITAYGSAFENTVYHSIFDNITIVSDLRPATRAAAAITKAIAYRVWEGNFRPLLNPNRTRDLLNCLALPWSGNRCQLAREYIPEIYKKYNTKVRAGNYPGSFFPITRVEDMFPGAYAKLSFVRAYLAYHTRYNVSEEINRDKCKNINEDGLQCETDEDCRKCEEHLNDQEERSPEDVHVRRVFCVKQQCIASDVYTHDAYGPAIESEFEDDAKDAIKFVLPRKNLEENDTAPIDAGWTESVWDPDIGLCGFVEDTNEFGVLIISLAVVTFVMWIILAYILERALFTKENVERGEDEDDAMEDELLAGESSAARRGPSEEADGERSQDGVSENV